MERFTKRTKKRSETRPVERFTNWTKEKTHKKNTLKQQTPLVAENSKAFQLLTDIGFDQETAGKLSEDRGLSEIKQQIAWLPKRKIDRNPLGMLRSAIQHNWSLPVEVQQRQRNRDNARKERQVTESKALESAEIDRVKKQLRQRRQQTLPQWKALSRDEQANIEQSASARLNSNFDRNRFKTNDDFRRKKCLDELCHTEGAIGITSSPIA